MMIKPILLFVVTVLSNQCQSDQAETLDIHPIQPDASMNSATLDWQQFFETPKPKTHKAKPTPASVGNLYAKAKTQIDANQLIEAEHNLQAHLRVHGISREPLLDLAMVFIRRHDLHQAYITLQSLKQHLNTLETVPSGFLFRYRYTTAVVYLLIDDHKEGRRILVDLIDTDSTFRPGYQALASSYLSEGKIEAAKFIIQRGLDQSEPSPAFYNLLGSIEALNHNSLRAQQWFQKSLAMNKNHVPTLINQAKLAITQQKYLAATHHIEQAIQHNPQSVEALVTLGIIKQRTGDHKQSLIAFQKALDIHPSHTLARFNMATLLVDHFQKPIEALRYFHEVRQLSEPTQDLHRMASRYIDDIQ